ncbi:MAG: NifB/NifX family molybdenum-iron cluster-binding protein [Fusobacteriaceae bacterium]
MNEIKIVFPTNDLNTVESHFGHCSHFKIFKIEDNEVVGFEVHKTPVHEPGAFPKYLGNLNINVIITGGMGQKAIDLFKAQNIDVILGAAGNIEEVLSVYLNGLLNSNGTPCTHNHH